MNFLNEAKIHTSADKLSKVKAAAGPEDEIHVMEKKKKRPDYADVDGDGDRDEPMAKAFKDKEKVKEGKASKFLGALGVAAALLAVGQSNKSDSVLKAIDAKIEMADTPAENPHLKN